MAFDIVHKETAAKPRRLAQPIAQGSAVLVDRPERHEHDGTAEQIAPSLR